MVRAKMRLTVLKNETYSANPEHGSKTLRFDAVYDQKVAEDGSFQKATPSAFAEFKIDNADALKYFVPGKYYYFDVHEVPAPEQK